MINSDTTAFDEGIKGIASTMSDVKFYQNSLFTKGGGRGGIFP